MLLTDRGQSEALARCSMNDRAQVAPGEVTSISRLAPPRVKSAVMHDNDVPVLGILDAAYDTDADDGTWLRNVTQAAAPLLDAGLGVHGFHVDLLASTPFRDPVLVGGEPAWQACWRAHWWDELIEQTPAEAQRAMLRFGPVSHTTELFAAVAAQIESFAELLGRMEDEGYQHALARERSARSPSRLFYPESLNLVSLDPSGHGIALIGNRRAPAASPMAKVHRRKLRRLSGHLAAAARMRRRLGARRSITSGSEAILAPDGRVLHAEGAATSAPGLAALRDAARSVVRARQGEVRDPLAYWRALHAGRWTLVERFESDGRRILVARDNRSATVVACEKLSARERQVLGELALGQTNKEIAYRLGVTTSTVATHLQRSMRKLGAPDVRELVRRARAALDGAALDAEGDRG